MHPAFKKALAFGSLLFIGIMMGLSWRYEVETYGWAGLAWIGYFYWTIPISLILINLWIAFVSYEISSRNATWRRTGIFTIGLCISACLAWFMRGVLQITFNRFPFPPAILLLIPIPFVLWLLAKRMNFSTTWKNLAASTILWLAAMPVSIWLMKFLQDGDPANPIHSIKTGTIFPFLIIAIGLLFYPFFSQATSPAPSPPSRNPRRR